MKRDKGYEQQNARIRNRQLIHLQKLVNEDWDNPIVQAAAQRYLQVLIESVIGLARYVTHVTLGEKVHQARDAFDVLRDHEKLTLEQFKNIQAIIGFRNVLVHDYMDVNEDLVQDVVQEQAFLFLQQMAELLEHLLE